jgi:predicted transcriptional regulator
MFKQSDLEIRRKIYNLILKNPGLHAKRIAEILKISGQLADYHLLSLERNELIRSVKEAGYRRYYAEGKLGTEDRKRLSVLRQEIPLKIVLFLLKYPASKHGEILDSLNVAPSTLSYHLKKLIKNDIIYVHVSVDEKRYLVKNEREIINLLIKYKPYSWIDNFEDVWMDFSWK